MLQPIADAVKLMFKEIIVPTNANRFLFVIAPILSIGPALAASVITEGQYINVNRLGAGLFVASLLLILPPVIAQAKSFDTVALESGE